jgi:hypothetical protein
MNMKTLKVLVATFVVLLATHLNGQASPITASMFLRASTSLARTRVSHPEFRTNLRWTTSPTVK